MQIGCSLPQTCYHLLNSMDMSSYLYILYAIDKIHHISLTIKYKLLISFHNSKQDITLANLMPKD